MRWRKEILLALADASEGVLSVLEYRYVHRVERPHGLPAAQRQARVRGRTGSVYLDNLYEEHGVCAELDGRLAHPADELWRDKHRDNDNMVRGIDTLRFSWSDVSDRPCETATIIATVLKRHNWQSPPHPCSRPGCAVPTS